MAPVLSLVALVALPCASQDSFLSLASPLAADRVAEPLTSSSTDNYEPDCQGEDRGWPRFASAKDLRASKWASYFRTVYGELPAAYPVCVKDFAKIDGKALLKANITEYTPVSNLSSLKDGDLFVGLSQPLQLYHDSYEPAAPNTWVEITHAAFPTEKLGMWCWRTRGSGVWFNTGKTITFPTPPEAALTHKVAIEYLKDGCSTRVSSKWPIQESDIFGTCAREKGLDSIQFEPTTGVKPVGVFGQPGLTELVITGLDGQYNCGTEDAKATPLRSGWKASRHCECENVPTEEACGLMPRAPFPMSLLPPLFVEPPLCELQRKRFWKVCNPATCTQTFCKVPSSP